MNICWPEEYLAHHLAYSFLGNAFYEMPAVDFITLLASQHLFDDWMLANEQDETQTGLRLLQSFCRDWTTEQYPALKQDYTRLFVGPGSLLAVPWESVYRSIEHLMFEKQTLEVRRLYQQYGFTNPRLYVEPDDHIGLELRFIAHLSSLGLDAVRGDQAEKMAQVEAGIRSFLNDHVLQWAHTFLDNVLGHSQSDYYRGIAHLTRGCLAQTADTFSVERLQKTP